MKLNSDAREWVQRLIGTRNNPKYTSKSVKSDGGILIVWIFIKSNGTQIKSIEH